MIPIPKNLLGRPIESFFNKFSSSTIQIFMNQKFKIEMLKYFKVKFDEVPNCCSNIGHTKIYVFGRVRIYDELGNWYFKVGHRIHRHAYGLKIKTLNDLIVNIIQSETEMRWHNV